MTDLQSRTRLPYPKLKSIGRVILKSAGFRRAEVSFLFVNDRRMKTLQKRYRGVDGLTDVLAFSQLEGRPAPRQVACLLGDVVISVDAAIRQGPEFGNAFFRELVLYMVHGVLHLLSYDDEEPCARKIMRSEEERIMKKIEEQVSLSWPSRKPKPL